VLTALKISTGQNPSVVRWVAQMRRRGAVNGQNGKYGRRGACRFKALAGGEPCFGLATAIPKSTGHTKRYGQRFGIPCLPYSVLARAGGGSFVLDFLCYFLVSRQESRRKKTFVEDENGLQVNLTPFCRPPPHQ